MRPSSSIYARFRSAAITNPAATAVTIDGQSFAYGHLLELVDRCAGGLVARGAEPGCAVAVALPNTLDFVVTALATFAVGGVLTPLNPRFKEDEMRHYLGASRPRVLVRPAALAGLVAAVDVPIPVEVETCAELSAAAAGSAGLPPQQYETNALTGIYMFSSGSTGKSKRVTRTQGEVLAEYEALARTIGLVASDRILCTVPLFHAHGFGNALLASLLSGAELVILTKEFNARATMQTLEACGISVYPAVPFMFKMLTETRFSSAPDLSRLRLAFSAGAALPDAVSRRFFELFGRTVSQLYGSTETGALTINLAHALEKPGSVGLPLAGMSLEIREETGRVLAAGETGEIWVKSAAATHEYDGLPELTKECFVDGSFFAGDMGMLDEDGYLYITGRKKLLINVAGYKVDPLEVEEVLAEHAQVAEVVVLGVKHAGSGEKIKAVVVLKEEGSCSADALLRYAESRLAEYKLPKLIEFRSEIPKSPLGKVLRKYLES